MTENHEDNVISLVPDDLRQKYTEEDLVLLHDLAERQGVKIEKVLRSPEIEEELGRLNDRLEAEKRNRPHSSHKEVEKPIIHQKRWYLGQIISGLVKESELPLHLEEESSTG